MLINQLFKTKASLTLFAGVYGINTPNIGNATNCRIVFYQILQVRNN